ncbi:MAG: phospholipid carrier-dependent glycosyltransferase [Azospirillum sp.]|nr:phospholipid carrier-dependent glycosyltransferase [Azospirillum sp.]
MTLPVGALWLLAGSLWFGLGQLALLPPWEGFDETAHYASIQQIAATGTLPRLGDARLSRETERYRALAPMPYASTPPFEQNGATTYFGFFAGSPASIAAAAEALRARLPQTEFEPGNEANWEAQHPPLYYLLMAPLFRLAATWPLLDRLFVLRLASFALAFGGLAIACVANAAVLFRHPPGPSPPAAPRQPVLVTALVAGWPWLMPMWFPTMARIGNDSLCLCLMSLSWAWLIRLERPQAGARDHLLLGVTLGLGCLTKAFFLPVAAGIAAFLALRRVIGDRSAETGRSDWRNLALMVAATAAIGLPWYLFGPAGGRTAAFGVDFAALGGAGGFLARWSDLEAPLSLLHSVTTIAKSFLWAGTWSFGRPPLILLLPLAAFSAILAVGYLRTLPPLRSDARPWAPLFFVVPILAGLVFHAIVWVTLYRRGGGTPGWYLHILLGPLALAAARGARAAAGRPAARLATSALASYAIAFGIVVTGLQLLMFTGCLFKAGDVVAYQWPADPRCLVDGAGLVSRLAVLGRPALGLPCLATGLGLLAVGLFRASREHPEPPSAP